MLPTTTVHWYTQSCLMAFKECLMKLLQTRYNWLALSLAHSTTVWCLLTSRTETYLIKCPYLTYLKQAKNVNQFSHAHCMTSTNSLKSFTHKLNFSKFHICNCQTYQHEVQTTTVFAFFSSRTKLEASSGLSWIMTYNQNWLTTTNPCKKHYTSNCRAKQDINTLRHTDVMCNEHANNCVRVITPPHISIIYTTCTLISRAHRCSTRD